VSAPERPPVDPTTPAPPGERSGWEAAVACGCDMSLVERNLVMTPVERIRAHGRALALALALRDAMERRRAGS